MAAPNEGTTNGDSNGRVTLAVLGSMMQNLIKTVDALVERVSDDHDRITVLCTKQDRQDTWTKAAVGGAVSAIIGAIWALIKS